GGQLHGHGDRREGAWGDRYDPQHADLPGDVPLVPPGRDRLAPRSLILFAVSSLTPTGGIVPSVVHNLTSIAGIVAIAAAAVAVIALLSSLALAIRLRRVRSEQQLVL